MVELNEILEKKKILKNIKTAVCKRCEENSDLLICHKHKNIFCRFCLKQIEKIELKAGVFITKFAARCDKLGNCNYYPLNPYGTGPTSDPYAE